MFRGVTSVTVGLAAAALALTPTAVAASPVSHARFWTAGPNLNCGLEIGSTDRVLCSATGIPAPRGPAGAGDPGFVDLGAVGSPKLLRLSQDSFVSDHVTKLTPGAMWSGRGVTCHVAPNSTLCFNGSNHGFLIGNGHYRSF